MRFLYRFTFFVLLILIAGCARATPTVSLTQAPTQTPTLSPPGLHTTQAPDVEAAAQAYLAAWKAEDYPGMYAMLTSVSTEAITEEDFTTRYKNVAAEAALSSVDTRI